jgi:hypothetical protein
LSGVQVDGVQVCSGLLQRLLQYNEVEAALKLVDGMIRQEMQIPSNALQQIIISCFQCGLHQQVASLYEECTSALGLEFPESCIEVQKQSERGVNSFLAFVTPLAVFSHMWRSI